MSNWTPQMLAFAQISLILAMAAWLAGLWRWAHDRECERLRERERAMYLKGEPGSGLRIRPSSLRK